MTDGAIFSQTSNLKVRKYFSNLASLVFPVMRIEPAQLRTSVFMSLNEFRQILAERLDSRAKFFINQFTIFIERRM